MAKEIKNFFIFRNFKILFSGAVFVVGFISVFGMTGKAQAAYVNSSTTSGTSGTPWVTVPAGVQAGDIVILTATIDNVSDTFTYTWPSGFTQLYDSDITPDGQSVGVAWKRLTGSDSGSYTLFSVGTSADWVCQAFAYGGRSASSDPAATQYIQNSGQSSPVSITATGVTAVAGDDLLWLSAPDVLATGIGNGHVAPTNYIIRQDAENLWSNLSGATRENVSAGATGNITGTFSLTSGTAGWASYLIRLPVSSSVSAALAGTITSATTKANIVSGGKTITLTLTGDTWVAAGSTFDAQRQNIINGFVSAQGETHGWNNEVKAKIAVTDVVRTSNTIVTITLDPEAAYDITSDETITATIPATAVAGAAQIIASPTFTISAATSTKDVYYSVGQSAADLKTGSPTVNIASGTATFSVAQTGNIGVGDRVTYNTNQIAYISAKTNSDMTRWSLITATGGVPADISNSTVVSITREYTSLAAAVAGATDANHLNTANLLGGNYQLNFPCYYDTGPDTDAVYIISYTTGANNYIKIYTPNNTTTEVNNSQRHQGKWDDNKYSRIVSDYNAGIALETGFVRIEGLQFFGTTTNWSDLGLIEVDNTNEVFETYFSDNILKGDGIARDYRYGMNFNNFADSSTFYIYNNLIYNLSDESQSRVFSIRVVSYSLANLYIYNNTMPGGDTVSIDDPYSTSSPSNYTLKNNIYKNNVNVVGTFQNNLNGEPTYFDPANNDFHLSKYDIAAKNAGVDLSADANLAFNIDIDGDLRPFESYWDIGADEVRYVYSQLQSSQNSFASNGLLALWTFDAKDVNSSTAFDRSGNSKDIDLSGGPTSAIGKKGQALRFDGSNDNAVINEPVTTSLWDNSGTPSDSADTNAVEVGTKFTADVSGQATGVKFYKTAANTGTHIGNLWTTGGTRLATVTFSGETSSGWQQANFASSVSLTAGTTYIVSYYAPAGHYAATNNYFASVFDHAPLHALANSTSANGVYLYSGASAFPTQTYQANNYWVDVVFLYGSGGGTINNAQAVSFWVKPSSTTQSVMNLDATKNIDISAGVVRANNFSTPTIYVDGVATATFPNTDWHYVTITTATPFDATALNVGKIGSTYFSGFLDDIRIYNRALSQGEISQLYHLGQDKITSPEASKGNTNGLVGYWSFDGSTINGATVNDLSGNGNNGTITGATPSLGKLGQALSFNGANSKASVGNTNQSINSIAFWVKPNSTSQYLIDLDGGTHYVRINAGTVAAVGFSTPTIYVDGSAGSTFPDINWHHITITTATSFNASNLIVGLAASNYFSGALDDIRIYNRALASSEIQQLYKTGQAVIRK